MVSPTFKCLIYILIAALTALSAELTNIKEFSEITFLKGVVIATEVILQGLVALRAFLDQSISKNDIK